MRSVPPLTWVQVSVTSVLPSAGVPDAGL